MNYEKINWTTGEKVREGYVIINGQTYQTVQPEYTGETPINIDNLNHMDEGIYKATPIVLYDNSEGTTGDVTLSDDIANYYYLEVFYTDNNKTLIGSQKVIPINGKSFLLTFVNNYKNPGGTLYNYLYIKKMTANNNVLTKTLETYLQISGTTISSLREADYVYITKVLGYKK